MALFRRCPGSLRLALVLVPLLAQAVGSLATDGYGDIAVFWGRNKDEGTLREACDTGAYTTVLISFLRAFGHGSYSLDLAGHALAGVGDDIKHCQSKGILVLLSIGGPAPGGSYSLPSTQSAADVAAYLWDAYLGGSRPGLCRPFGDAAVDGVDFYIDGAAGGGGDHYDELARRLYAYNSQYRGRLGVMLTATVRCAYPELPGMQAALATGHFARIHVRHYGSINCTEFQREDAEAWMAAYPGSRVFVGVSVEDKRGGEWGTGDLKDLYYDVLQFVMKLPNYGGLMIWNRYYDKKNHFISDS